jgi:hypothetical protein
MEMLQSITVTRELGIRNNRQNTDLNRAKRGNQRRNAKSSKRVLKNTFSKEFETMEAEIEKLKKQKEELTKMAKEGAKPVFKRKTAPLRPDNYQRASPPTDQANEPGPSNLSMLFQRGASADYELYRPSQEVINAHFRPPPTNSNNYGHFIPPTPTYPPTFDPFQAPPGHGLGHQVPSQSSQQFPLATDEENQYWDAIDDQYPTLGLPDWSQSHYS